jgi:Ni/Fe-hydrogenase subunit HybB-like protein
MKHAAHSHEEPAPVRKPFFSPGMKLLTGIMLAGLSVGMYRMLKGLDAVTHLNDQYPLGLWIGVDVATGVALAAGGFTSSALVYVFRRDHFHVLIRPALLTALLGYTFVGIGLMFDLGRWYNIWHPAVPIMWQGNSVLFEVGMCVMIYLTVLYIEFGPIVCERFIGRVDLPGPLSRFNDYIDIALRFGDFILNRCMFIFIIAGIVLSCLHQSSLGTLMLIAPYKMHPLYQSSFGPLFFLTSAIAAGFAMIICESIISSKVFGEDPEMHVLSPLARIVPWLMGVYIFLKLGDMLVRGTYVFLFENSSPVIMFWIEFGLLTVVPWILFMSADIRRSAGALFAAAFMYVCGILFNRCTVFFIAYEPLYAQKAYVPALGEFAVTIGLICALVFVYRGVVTLFPVLPQTTGHNEGC